MWFLLTLIIILMNKGWLIFWIDYIQIKFKVSFHIFKNTIMQNRIPDGQRTKVIYTLIK